jgi:glycosyltransferase involved in cell wall biosynthesis
LSVQVSIIVPVYNLEGYVERCLSSVLEQDFTGPYEILVVNDGSTDGSQPIIDDFAARHPERLRSFSTPNRGPGAASNYGIERARGDYLMFVEGDDWIGPRVVAEMHASAVATGADLLIGTIRRHYARREDSLRPLPHLSGVRRVEGEDFGMLLRSQPSPCARLYGRSLFEDPEVRFLEDVIYADVGFVPKTYWAARSIYYADREWYDYELKRPEQSVRNTSKRVMDIVPSLLDGLRFYQRRGAFERYRDELEYYAIQLVLIWIHKIGVIRDYPVRQGMRDIFGVLDEFFPGWVDGKPFAEIRPGPMSRLHMKVSRATRFIPLLWPSRIEQAFRRAHRIATRAAHEPAWALAKTRGKLERAFGLANDPTGVGSG